MNYYNTNNEIGTELKKSREKAKSQDELVLLFFKEHDQLGVHLSEFFGTFKSWSRYLLTSGQRHLLLQLEGRFLTSKRKG